MEEKIALCKEMALPLLRWYDGAARLLPWREEVSAYGTWVSEIMLQQTRVSAVLPYFQRFMAAFPTVEALAEAEEEQLLKLWEGLGYYSRARNLQRAARIIVQEHGGVFPRTYEALTALPGIGDYTAGAILSIAFGENVPAVDGNVLRVVSRYLDLPDDVTDTKVRRQIRTLMADAMPADRPGAYNQALMDLGAMVCLPHGEPKCQQCPLREKCRGYAAGHAASLPRRREKKPRRVEERTLIIALQEGKVALRKRKKQGLLGGLWEFPGVEGTWEEGEVAQLLMGSLRITDWLSQRHAKHVFTHVEWHMTGYFLRVSGQGEKDWVWVDRDTFLTLAIPSAFSDYRASVLRLLEEEA